jgi:hypothetical protein
MPRLRSLLITDSATVALDGVDVVLWLGPGRAPAAFAAGSDRIVLEPSSAHAAAVYASSDPARIRLALADPLPFVVMLVDVARAPALRAA